MDKIKIPEGYQQIMPYLILNNAGAFSTFMQDVFQAKEVMRKMRDESIVMHAEVKVGDITIMFADSTTQYEVTTGSFFIYVMNADETYTKALSQGASSIMSPSDQSYGRSCGIKDPLGNTWWITSVKPQ